MMANTNFNLVGSDDGASLGGGSTIGLIAGDTGDNVSATDDTIVTQGYVTGGIFGSDDTIDISDHSSFNIVGNATMTRSRAAVTPSISPATTI